MINGAGRLFYRLQFESRAEPVEDGMGNTISGDWTPQFEAHCGVTYLKGSQFRGSEEVLASRLEARSIIVIAIRNSANARRITHEWRARDVRSGVIYEIKERPRPTDDRAYVEMLAMSGVAA